VRPLAFGQRVTNENRLAGLQIELPTEIHHSEMSDAARRRIGQSEALCPWPELVRALVGEPGTGRCSRSEAAVASPRRRA
jgi:hypothetical protein